MQLRLRHGGGDSCAELLTCNSALSRQLQPFSQKRAHDVAPMLPQRTDLHGRLAFGGVE